MTVWSYSRLAPVPSLTASILEPKVRCKVTPYPAHVKDGNPRELDRIVITRPEHCPFWNRGTGTWRHSHLVFEVDGCVRGNNRIHHQYGDWAGLSVMESIPGI